MLTLLPGFKFPMPDWEDEFSRAPQQTDVAVIDAYCTGLAKDWCALLAPALGPDYVVTESNHFLLVDSQTPQTRQRILNWAEQAHSRLSEVLCNTVGRLVGKIPVLMTADLDTYYEYLAQYYPEGDHALSGGVYLNHGYGHLLFCHLDFAHSHGAIAHELAHSFLAGLPIPVWLNEGVAQLAEIALAGQISRDLELVRETIDSFWTPDTIQEFWRGESFQRPDEGQLQSYHLALVLTRRLATDAARFRAFLAEASFEDAGESALQNHWGISLQSMVAEYLGPGDWAPKPDPAS
ncbi:MAG: hypothetical protein J0M24_04550 [Verrucomicrobia bacterium]|nr:hypothetical protein [Verrucomicrobiota bacterium]